MITKLFIDSSSPRLVFSIIIGDLIKSKNIMTDKNMTNIFISELNQFLEECGVDKKRINELFFINGPGTFSGIRIGSVFANTFKTISNIRLFTLSSCQFQMTRKDQLSIIDAKSKLYYVNQSQTISLLTIEQINEVSIVKKLIILDDYLNYDFNLSWEYNKEKFSETLIIEPNYIKPAL